LAAHEVEVGRYYLKAEKYPAAIHRLEGVFKKYPNYYDRAEAYYLLGQAYLLAGDKAKASEAFNSLFNQFPQSEFILASQKFIEKNY
jgi:outer membrane protein assembly factor BamD